MNLETNRKITPLKKLKLINNKDIFLKRDDLIHPLISGNKWRKLHGQPILKSHEHLVTFGGAFSNHLVAVAYYAFIHNMSSTGFVRTDHIDIHNPTLNLCKHYGMILININREEYKLKEHGVTVQAHLASLDEYYLIPEGGTNAYSSKGFTHLIEELEEQLGKSPDIICCAYGTGGTSRGIISHMNPETAIFINPVFKGISEQELKREFIDTTNASKDNVHIIPSYKNLRYGKLDESLLEIVDQFLVDHQILLDPIYTARLIGSIQEHDFWKTSMDYQDMIIYHSGGIQGWGGIFYRKPKLKLKYPRIYEAFIDYYESNLI